MKEHGQDVRFVKYYLQQYCRNFERVFVFSYKNEKYDGLPDNCELVCPKRRIHRYLYGMLAPFLHQEQFRKCDVFRCFHPTSVISAMVARIILNKKFIFNYNYDYGLWAIIEKKAMLLPLIKLLEWLAFKFCDRVFVADEEMEKYAGKFIRNDKIVLVRNGVDTIAFCPRSNSKQTDRKVVLSVGRLESQKNYLQLVEAISLLKSRKVKLIIVGKGSLKEKLVQRASEVGVGLKIIGVIPNDKLPETYNIADVYTQPSLAEAPVKTLLEAMSCGLPCVATNVLGIKHVIKDGENGLLAKLEALDLANKIDLLLTNKPLANRLGARARSTVLLKYDLKKFLHLETEILKSI